MGKSRSRRRYDQFDKTAMMNNRTFYMFYNRIVNIALNVYEWKNLPPTIDERFLELALFELGYCLYFNDPVIGDLALTCMIGGELNVYRIPIWRRAYATNGYQAERDARNSVIIFNNYTHTPTIEVCDQFAWRLYQIQRAIDVNINAQKTPVMIITDKNQRLVMENLYMKYDGNQPFIFGNENLDVDGVKVLKTDAPFIADKLEAQLHQTWNEIYTYFGVEASNQDKKERLVSSETNGNSGATENARFIGLNARRQACDQINRMFGTNIECNFRSNLATLVNRDNLNEEIVDDELGTTTEKREEVVDYE